MNLNLSKNKIDIHELNVYGTGLHCKLVKI